MGIEMTVPASFQHQRESFISWWGIASLALLFGQYAFGEYNFRLEDVGQPGLVSRTTHYELCLVVQSAAAICGIMAVKRGTKLWVLSIIPAAILALQCLSGDL
jgi:hypothetical protein